MLLNVSCGLIFSYLSYIAQDPCLWNGSTHSGPSPPVPINNQDNPHADIFRGQSDPGKSSTEASPLKWF